MFVRTNIRRCIARGLIKNTISSKIEKQYYQGINSVKENYLVYCKPVSKCLNCLKSCKNVANKCFSLRSHMESFIAALKRSYINSHATACIKYSRIYFIFIT